MSGEWETAGYQIWRIQRFHFKGQCEIEIRRRLHDGEETEYKDWPWKSMGKFKLSREDVEVLYRMMLASTRPDEKD
jgi:hypothetical protein